MAKVSDIANSPFCGIVTFSRYMPFDHSDVLALTSQVAAAPSVTAALGVTAERLAALLDAPCTVLERSDSAWRVVASAGAAAEGPIGSFAASSDLPLRVGHREYRLLVGTNPLGSAYTGAVSIAALAEALQNALTLVALREDQEDATHRNRRLFRFSRRLQKIEGPPRLHQFIVAGIADAVDAEIAALAVYAPDENALAIVATCGYPSVLVEDLRVPPGQGIIGRVFASGQPLFARGMEDLPPDARRKRYRTDSFIAAPLGGSRGAIGVIAVTDPRNRSAFSTADLVTVRTFAVPASLALARDLQRSRSADLAHLATVDPLTGVFNRRQFDTRLEEEIERQRRSREDLALLIVDIDDFKALNDACGHLEGDRVLRELADILRRAVRIFDVCARYGGEEFAILMPRANTATALQVAERIRTHVEDYFQTRSRRFGENPPLTVSIGVATAVPGSTGESLIGRADAALLKAKATGKNVVQVSTSTLVL